VFKLKAGSTGFKGNVISFPQRISDIATSLPRVPKEVKIIIVRSSSRSKVKMDSCRP